MLVCERELLMMAMATSAAAIVVVMLLATTFVATSATSTTFVAQMVQHVLNLFVCGIAVFQYHPRKLQCLSCQRMVGIDGHTIFLHLLHACHEAMLFLVHQRDYGTRKDVLVVEMVIDAEYFTLHLVDTLRHIVAKSLAGLEGEVKLFLSLKWYDMLLEGIEREAEATDKRKRGALLGLFYQLLGAIGLDGIELIAHGDVLVFLLIHIIYNV